MKPFLRLTTIAIPRLRIFCQQWRHCYLLLFAMLGFVWRAGKMAMPTLGNIRSGGMHPIEVFSLMNMFKVMWLLPLVIVLLYAFSFAVKPLNTAAAIAGSALCSCAILVFVLLWTLMTIIFNFIR